MKMTILYLRKKSIYECYDDDYKYNTNRPKAALIMKRLRMR